MDTLFYFRNTIMTNQNCDFECRVDSTNNLAKVKPGIYGTVDHEFIDLKLFSEVQHRLLVKFSNSDKQIDDLISFVMSEANLKDEKKEISVGSALPFGPRMFYQSGDNLVRMKDIGVNKRIMVIGVLGSFTPDCWNRHLYLVLKYYDYYKSRGVDHICCISTNDPFVQNAWGFYIGCEDKLLMWSDPTAKYTKSLGMEVTVPWLDSKIRSKRYVILADDMIVTKIIKCDKDNGFIRWDCDHLLIPDQSDEEDSNLDFQI